MSPHWRERASKAYAWISSHTAMSFSLIDPVVYTLTTKNLSREYLKVCMVLGIPKVYTVANCRAPQSWQGVSGD